MKLEYEILNMISVSILLKLLGLTINHLLAFKFFELGNLVRGVRSLDPYPLVGRRNHSKTLQK